MRPVQTFSRLAWKTNLGGFIHDAPIVADEHVCFGSTSGHFNCALSIDGQVLWSTQLEPHSEMFRGTHLVNYPNADQSRICAHGIAVPSSFGYVQLLSQDSGECCWKTRIGRHICGTVVSSEGLLVYGAMAESGSPDWKVMGLCSSTGAISWERPIPGSCFALAGNATKSVVISKTEQKQKNPTGRFPSVITLVHTYIHCISASDGTVLWTLEHDGAMSAYPGIVGNTVVLSTLDDMRGVDLDTGETRWSIANAPWALSTPLLIRGRLLFVNEQLLAYDMKQHQLIYRTSDYSHYERSAPAVCGEYLYVGGGRNNSVDCRRFSTGELVWQYETGDMVFSSPVISGNRLLIGSHDGCLYCFESE